MQTVLRFPALTILRWTYPNFSFRDGVLRDPRRAYHLRPCMLFRDAPNRPKEERCNNSALVEPRSPIHVTGTFRNLN